MCRPGSARAYGPIRRRLRPAQPPTKLHASMWTMMRTGKCVSRPIGRPHDELRARAMLRLHRRADFNRSGSRHLLVAPAAARVHTVDGSVGPRAGMTTTPPIATHVRRPTRLSSVAELVTTAWLCICVRRGVRVTPVTPPIRIRAPALPVQRLACPGGSAC